MKRALMMSVAALSIGVLAYWAGARERESPRVRVPPARATSSAANTQAMALQTLLAQARADAEARARSAPEVSGASEGPNPRATGTDEGSPGSQPAAMSFEEARAHEQALRDQDRAALEQRFSEQTVDRGWSSESEKFLENGVLSAKLVGVRVEGVSCRSNICKLSLTHAAPRMDRTSMRRVLRGIRGELEHQIFQEEGRTTIYSIRSAT